MSRHIGSPARNICEHASTPRHQGWGAAPIYNAQLHDCAADFTASDHPITAYRDPDERFREVSRTARSRIGQVRIGGRSESEERLSDHLDVSKQSRRPAPTTFSPSIWSGPQCTLTGSANGAPFTGPLASEPLWQNPGAGHPVNITSADLVCSNPLSARRQGTTPECRSMRAIRS